VYGPVESTLQLPLLHEYLRGLPPPGGVVPPHSGAELPQSHLFVHLSGALPSTITHAGAPSTIVHSLCVGWITETEQDALFPPLVTVTVLFPNELYLVENEDPEPLAGVPPVAVQE